MLPTASTLPPHLKSRIVASDQDIGFITGELKSLITVISTIPCPPMEQTRNVYYTQCAFERIAKNMPHESTGRVCQESAIALANKFRKKIEKGCKELQLILHNGNSKKTHAMVLTLSAQKTA